MIVIDGTPELLEEFYGERPRKSMSSVVVVDNGKPVGVAGLSLQNNMMVLFSDMSDEFRQSKGYKRALVVGARKLMKRFPKMPVHAKASPGIEGSEELLKHLGFTHIRGDIWQV